VRDERSRERDERWSKFVTPSSGNYPIERHRNDEIEITKYLHNRCYMSISHPQQAANAARHASNSMTKV
jgi:hypothetical protein